MRGFLEVASSWRHALEEEGTRAAEWPLVRPAFVLIICSTLQMDRTRAHERQAILAASTHPQKAMALAVVW
jgi:hypothetical protein